MSKRDLQILTAVILSCVVLYTAYKIVSRIPKEAEFVKQYQIKLFFYDLPSSFTIEQMILFYNPRTKEFKHRTISELDREDIRWKSAKKGDMYEVNVIYMNNIFVFETDLKDVFPKNDAATMLFNQKGQRWNQMSYR